MDKVTGVFLYFYPQASFIHAWRCDIAICLREELSGLHISSTYIHFMSSLERKISEWYSSVCIIETRQSSELRKSEELGEEAVHLEVFAHSLWKFLIEEDTLKKKKKKLLKLRIWKWERPMSLQAQWASEKISLTKVSRILAQGRSKNNHVGCLGGPVG